MGYLADKESAGFAVFAIKPKGNWYDGGKKGRIESRFTGKRRPLQKNK
jgi:hypothetical protein